MAKQSSAPVRESANQVRGNALVAGQPLTAGEPLRVVVENVRPRVDDGRFPIKRTAGETVEVHADIFADGHDALAAVLRHRPQGEEEWSEAPMEPLGNDQWRASFEIGSLGAHEFTIAAWPDRFTTWRLALAKKAEAGLDVSSELLEGAELVKQAAERAVGADREWLSRRARELANEESSPDRVTLALDGALTTAMARHPDRSRATTLERPLPLWADRERARFGTWYEMFPRSARPEPGAARHLPRRSRRGCRTIAGDGLRRALPAADPPDRQDASARAQQHARRGARRPGQPLGASAPPRAGTRRSIPSSARSKTSTASWRAARGHGIEIALDIAFQCSPDHPYVREHPEWFRAPPRRHHQVRREPAQEVPGHLSLRFRVRRLARPVGGAQERRPVLDRPRRQDLPRRQPAHQAVPLLGVADRARCRARIPTPSSCPRPSPGRRSCSYLAKVGFTQSYTYFTWRNTKARADRVLHRADPDRGARVPAAEPVRQHARHPARVPASRRPAGVPDPPGAGRDAGRVNYGIYGPPFELCEAPRSPGHRGIPRLGEVPGPRLGPRRPAHLRDLITRANRARREHRALQFDHRLRFHAVDNEHLIAYTKTTPDLSNVVLVVVNLDPRHPQEGWVRLPLRELGLPEHEPYQVHDLLDDQRYLWQRDRNFVRLDPQVCTAHLFVIQPRIPSERTSKPTAE